MNTTVSLPLNTSKEVIPEACNQMEYRDVAKSVQVAVDTPLPDSEIIEPIDPSELEHRIQEHQSFINSRCKVTDMTSCCYFKNDHNFVRVCEWGTMDEYVKSNNNMCLPQHTDTVCWWDFERFSHRPVVMPLRYYESIVWEGTLIKDLWLYGGNFCSFKCLKRYIESGERIVFNDSHIDPQYIKTLTNMMFQECYETGNKTFDDIEPAPPRQALKKMGGVLTIEQFRGIIDQFEIISTPMIAVIPKLVQKIDNSMIMSAIKQNAVFPKKDGSYDDEYSLKRSKKRPCEKNTLKSFFSKRKGRS